MVQQVLSCVSFQCTHHPDHPHAHTRIRTHIKAEATGNDGQHIDRVWHTDKVRVAFGVRLRVTLNPDPSYYPALTLYPNPNPNLGTHY